MPLPAKPYEQWGPEDLNLLLSDPPAEENARLDFKRECNLLDSDAGAKNKARHDVLKDVCAMANADGGLLLVGVDECREEGRPPIASTLVGIDDASIEPIKAAIAGLVDHWLDVRPSALRFKPVALPDEGAKSVLVVQVPANVYSLSMVTYEQKFQFWVRRGCDNRPMTTAEVQYAMERMRLVRREAEKELRLLREGVLSGEYTSSRGWFAAVPLDRSRDHVPVRRDEINSVLRNSCFYRRRGWTADSPIDSPKHYVGRLHPSLHGLAYVSSDELNRLEIGRDGTVTLTRRLRQECGAVILDAIYLTWAIGLSVIKDLQDNFSVSRRVVAQVGINSRGPIEFSAWSQQFPGEHIVLSPVMLDEGVSLSAVFTKWATQLANSVGEETPAACEGWVER